MIAGRHVPYPSGELPEDFPERLDRLKRASGLSWDSFAEAVGVERKQVLRWRRGTEPSGMNLAHLLPTARVRRRYRRLPRQGAATRSTGSDAASSS